MTSGQLTATEPHSKDSMGLFRAQPHAHPLRTHLYSALDVWSVSKPRAASEPSGLNTPGSEHTVTASRKRNVVLWEHLGTSQPPTPVPKTLHLTWSMSLLHHRSSTPSSARSNTTGRPKMAVLACLKQQSTTRRFF